MNLFVPVRFVQLGEISIRKCIDGVSNETSREGEGFRLNEIAIIQPALFAVQVALAALWCSWGIAISVSPILQRCVVR